MADFSLSLTTDEQSLIVRLLEQELSETRTEFRHTDSSPDYRADVKAEEDLLRQVLEKFRKPVA